MADNTVNAKPRFASNLQLASAEDRVARLTRQHGSYTANLRSWNVLLDAFEGRGGFLDGSYLWPHPREEATSFNERKAMARYHNYLETLVDLYVRFMFTKGVRRTSSSREYNAWLEDVDGAGTTINDFLRRLAAVSLVNGHAGMLIDKTPDAPTGPSRADERARVMASVFTAPAIQDWRYSGNSLAAVKLLEAADQPGIADEHDSSDAQQYLLWDREGWARFAANGDLISADTPQLGLVPLVILRPKPSQLSPILGRALVSNANVIQALYNRASEEDEVLRSQAFSVLTVEVAADGDVNEAKQQLGNVVGTAKALVVRGSIKYETPDQNVPHAIRENIAYLVQEMYRAAHVRFKRDSLAAESGESIRLQYTELNEMLQGMAKSLAQAEKEMARCYFAWQHPTAEAGRAASEAAKVEAIYPDEFFLDDLMTDLEAWAEGLRMNLGPTMSRRIKKRAVRRIDPDVPADELKQIDQEIDEQPDEMLLPPVPPAPDTGGNDDEGEDIDAADEDEERDAA